MDEEQQNVITRIPSSRNSSRSPETPRQRPMSPSTSSIGSESRTRLVIKSLAIYFCTFSYAVGFNFIAPTIIDFSRKFNTDVSHVSLVFTVLTSAYLFGALISGILNNFIHRQVIVVCVLSCASTTLFLFPQVPDINYFFMLGGFLGFAGGGWDALQIAWIIDIWRNAAPPFILTQHFCYSLGTILPPLILAPYLDGTKPGPAGNITTPPKVAGLFAELEILKELPDINTDPGMSMLSSNPISSSNSTVETSMLYIPFTIAGSLLGLAVVVQIVLFLFTFDFRRICRKRGTPRSGCLSGDTERLLDEDNNPPSLSQPYIVTVDPSEDQYGSQTFEEIENDDPILTPLQQSATEKGRRILLIVLSCCCIASYCGLELTTMQFLPTFAHFSKVAFTEAQGAQLLFSCNIAYCICRGVGILLVLKIPPHFILLGNIILLLISNTILLLFADNSETMLWLGSILIGCGMSTTFPAYYAFIEKYIFVSNGVSTTITVSAGMVSAIYPVIVGGSVEKNPSIMIYVNFVSISVLIVSFSITFGVTWLKNWREGNSNEANKRD